MDSIRRLEMIHTPVNELLNIEYPLIQGGMAWIADAKLAAAVSNAGGLGVIAAGYAPEEWVREEIRKARSLTKRPFALNIMLLNPRAEEIGKVAMEEKVEVIITGAGSPGKYISYWKKSGIKVLPVVPSVSIARRMEKMGVDAVIAEGSRCGSYSGYCCRRNRGWAWFGCCPYAGSLRCSNWHSFSSCL
jgi:enoyl-[acyl-carrier protein] reductase II